MGFEFGDVVVAYELAGLMLQNVLDQSHEYDEGVDLRPTS